MFNIKGVHDYLRRILTFFLQIVLNANTWSDGKYTDVLYEKRSIYVTCFLNRQQIEFVIFSFVFFSFTVDH